MDTRRLLTLALLIVFYACGPTDEIISKEPLLENNVKVDGKITGGQHFIHI